MAPKRTASSTKKMHSPLKQSTIAFKTRKSGALSPKAKAKATAKAKERQRHQGQSESDVESDVASRSSQSDEDDIRANPEKTELDVKDKAGLYKKYNREAREKMGWLPPIHNEGQTKIHNMLRVFDNTYDYGPCVGLTRLERWERAKAMGLNPPTEVRDILLTKQGGEDPSLVHTVFNGLV